MRDSKYLIKYLKCSQTNSTEQYKKKKGEGKMKWKIGNYEDVIVSIQNGYSWKVCSIN